MELANSGREEDCKALQDQLTKLNDLEQVLPVYRGLGLAPTVWNRTQKPARMHLCCLREGCPVLAAYLSCTGCLCESIVPKSSSEGCNVTLQMPLETASVSLYLLMPAYWDRVHLPVQRCAALLTWMHRPLRCCNVLAQDYHRLQGLNRKLTEFHSVLQKALKDSQGLSCYGISSQPNCLPQASSLKFLLYSACYCGGLIRIAPTRATMLVACTSILI